LPGLGLTLFWMAAGGNYIGQTGR